MPLEARWNTHFSRTVEQELFGIGLQLAQDPNSHNLGTTVWDASIVLAKYIEKNSRRGDFMRPKLRGKRALELGAGMGLAGMALALLGCDVAFTDIGDVLPLLRHNVEQNITPAALKLKDAAWAAAEVGKCSVNSLDWSDPSCFSHFRPPYDFILAADCVYSELAVPHLLQTMLHMGGPRTQIIVASEFRSQAVHDIFLAEFNRHYAIRKVPIGKLDPNYSHNLIHIFLLKRRKQPLAAEVEAEGGEAGGEAAAEAAGGETAAAGDAGQGEDQQAAAAAEEEDGLAAAAGAAGSGAEEAVSGQHQAADALPAAEDSAGAADGAAAGSAAASGLQEGAAGAAQPESELGRRSKEQFQTRREGSMLARQLADMCADLKF